VASGRLGYLNLAAHLVDDISGGHPESLTPGRTFMIGLSRMSKLSAKLTSQFISLLAMGAVCLLIVSATGAWGLGQTRWAAGRLYSDQLRTVDETSNVGQELDDAYEDAQAILLATNQEERQRATNDLLQDTAPQVEVALHTLRQAHAGDPPHQLELVRQLQQGWAHFKKLWTASDLFALSPDQATVSGQLQAVFGPIEGVTNKLVAIEQDEAAGDHRRAESAYRTSLILIAGVTTTEILLGVLFIAYLTRRILPRAMAFEEAQADFAEAIQLAGGQGDAQKLLVRHLEQEIPHSVAVVFNRNRTSDRLEPLSPLPVGSPLRTAVDAATGPSCKAIRSAHVHSTRAGRTQLLPCDVCGGCEGETTCTPLTVAGEIVGSVLLTRREPLDADDERRVRDSILQAAPVLANLRNLAVAEDQAATDSLTGLPNKRTVHSTVRRMVAQADRTATPLAALSLDLDYFKRINDTYGHGRGDDVLAAVGDVLRSVVRTSDFAGRNGGEEFLILLPSTARDEAISVAENIQKAIGRIRVPQLDQAVTASIGIALFPDHATDADALEEFADRALYAAKANGRNCVEVARGEASVGSIRPTSSTPLRTTT
jgi:diguanylate cyclase (GGDEF)-like protein